MPSALKIPYALHYGKLIHVSDVPRGLRPDCLCPACKGTLVARKGAKVVHHFAHYREADCQPETVAHLTAKLLLSDRIRSAISQHRPLPIVWQCQKCPGIHTGNLVRRATRVEIEFALPGCRPDIALLNPKGKVVAIVEVIVSHKPEQQVRDYCAANRVTLAEYEVTSTADLENLNADVIGLDRVDLCLRPVCPNCHTPLAERTLFIYKGNCRRCQTPMNIAEASTDGMSSGPEGFTPAERALAEKLGAVLKEQYSKTLERAYLANTCGQCGLFIGQHHLYKYCTPEHRDGGRVTGYRCLDCGHRRDVAAEIARHSAAA
jgi:ssDNA-binding Zn-finger/Zn-ribbon topoisomerase 1